MRKRCGLTACLLAFITLSPAMGDWLVTRDGAWVETKGAWNVKGNQVVFTLPNGTLSALRKSEIDLDASAVVTAQKKNPRPSADARDERKPVLVLTNENVRGAGEAQAERSAEAATEAATEEAATPSTSGDPAVSRGVQMVSWTSRDSSSVDGLEIVGTIRNSGSDIAANVTVKVTVINQDGSPLLDTSAFLRSTGLAPGKSTTFRALLPGVYSLFSDPAFEISSGTVSVGSPPPAETDEDDFDPSQAVEPEEG